MVKVITYNVNGIRSAVDKTLPEWLLQQNADIVCFQEIKADMTKIPTAIFDELGYKHYWYPAEKKGYSGVAILSKTEPKNVVYGCGNEQYDSEGRVIRADYDGYSVLCAYHPSGTSGEDRQAFKMLWLEYFLRYVNDLRKEIPNLILVGDYNICREPIDIHDPVSNKNSSGFLPEEREWFARFLSHGYVDTFRHANGDVPHQYTWWSFRANSRANNKGWRIDYVIVNDELKEKVIESKIVPDAKHSDHCPMYTVFDL
ncbi:MAG: exodeoxyribonuclease III [Bacteroidota bacterium]